MSRINHAPSSSEYQIELPPHARHRSLALVMTITSLALVGTAGTFGYAPARCSGAFGPPNAHADDGRLAGTAFACGRYETSPSFEIAAGLFAIAAWVAILGLPLQNALSTGRAA